MRPFPVKAATAALCLVLAACAVPVSTDSLQPGDGGGATFAVTGRSYEQVWNAARLAMSNDMTIVEAHKPTGVIKSRVVRGTPGKVVGFFIRPTEENARTYTVTVVSRKPLQTEFVDRTWEPSVVEDFKQALGLR